MVVYRLAKKEYVKDLSGEGARLYGGRWNKPGTPCLYVSESAALSVLEFVVHYNKEVLPSNVVMGKIEISDSLKIHTFEINDLPKNWDVLGINPQTQRFGTEFFNSNLSVGFKIPSAVSPFAFNLVLNPLHADYAKVKFLGFELFALDKRIKE